MDMDDYGIVAKKAGQPQSPETFWFYSTTNPVIIRRVVLQKPGYRYE